MRSTNIVEISANDSTQLMVRKINENFNSLYASLASEANTNLRAEAANTTSAITELENSIASVRNMLVNFMNDLNFEAAPPVGTYMYSKTNPANKWTGTTWTQIAEGNFLIAAGSKYKSGESYGSNEVTLTVDQIPAHTHTVSSGSSDTAGNAGVKTTTASTGTEKTSSTGGGKAHNNIPLSIAAPLWRRDK